ncbi:SDR family oxidoreductase [Pseudoroseicyclus aestuarii]|uniref:NAD(P)-dependent dehydrogenase (Short-subunit alcohol dehydrogenase family) n=1 Tax=Pseudoroseicyclus aestuarii TaxID=1795041 RepID=A0A318SW43_9RHOB|nr:SDR family oxidoreductase [Pseudoroseicyclus aestuarii]PYE84599.1 NAD(P)-dependent dehydrogenase (short-subunit alcohol dehydrogenase family) [Pseudoroseicyclus aestuarii]
MDVTLTGKRVLVTGGTQGIGAAIAEAAAKSGAAAVTLVGRDAEKGERVAERLRGHGCEVKVAPGDLAEAETPVRVFEKAVELMGGVDCLVNSAGLSSRASFLDAEPELFDKLFALNTRAGFFLMQQLIRHLKERGDPGAIVNVLSMNAHCGAPELAVYSGTKGAMATLTKNAANAHAADRIRANGIMLGWTDTAGERTMQAETLGKGEGWLEEAEARQPFGRLLKPEDVARLALYLLSDASGLQTGTLVDLEQRVSGAPPANVG